jgi:hypothetical protein
MLKDAAHSCCWELWNRAMLGSFPAAPTDNQWEIWRQQKVGYSILYTAATSQLGCICCSSADGEFSKQLSTEFYHCAASCPTCLVADP